MLRCLRIFTILVAITGSAAATTVQTTGPVRTDTGQVLGLLTGAERSVIVFKGIPYAAPPVGALRWRPPAPVAPWTGVREVFEFGAVAPQEPSNFGGVTADAEMSEDCLFLNVWTAAETRDAGLPVMVWIHGGGFRIGAGSLPLYDGTKLAEAGAVVVTFNYRLNVFGAFAHPLLTEESGIDASGNYGLMDQVEVLRWVRRNIAAFGGDPENVTIFGESAGGRSVSLLMVSPLTEGLFHRAIAHSGALRDTTTPLAEREEQGVEISDAVGATDLDALRALSWDAFPDAGSFASNPIVDGWVIQRNPEHIYADGQQHDIPLMAGINADEATYRLVQTGPRTVEAYRDFVVRQFGDNAPQILEAYRVDTDDQAYAMADEVGTDSAMTLHARRQMRWMEKVSSKAYLYYFTRVPPNRAGALLGAHHGSEIRYVFGNLVLDAADDFKVSHVDVQLSDALVQYWVQFARTGSPNVEGLQRWPAYEARTGMYLELGEEIRVGTYLHKDRLDVLEQAVYGAYRSE